MPHTHLSVGTQKFIEKDSRIRYSLPCTDERRELLFRLFVFIAFICLFYSTICCCFFRIIFSFSFIVGTSLYSSVCILRVRACVYTYTSIPRQHRKQSERKKTHARELFMCIKNVRQANYVVFFLSLHTLSRSICI